MTPDLPPFVIQDAAGRFRTAHGDWTMHRDQAVSFPDRVSAQDWMKATPRLGGAVSQVPVDINAKPPSPMQSDYDPVT